MDDNNLVSFRHYDTKEEFSSDLSKGTIDEGAISFIKDSKKIYTHDEFYGNSNTIKEGNFEVTELVIEDSEENPTNIVTRPEFESTLENYDTTVVVDTKISTAKKEVKDELIGTAPGTYDTLGEIHDYIEEHGQAAAALAATVATKANDLDLKELDSTVQSLQNEISTLKETIQTQQAFINSLTVNDNKTYGIMNGKLELIANEGMAVVAVNPASATTLDLPTGEFQIPMFNEISLEDNNIPQTLENKERKANTNNNNLTLNITEDGND